MPEAFTSPTSGEVFLEAPEFDGAYGHAIGVREVLYHKRSAYQDIHVISADGLGRLLILDGVIQTSELDETSYHEMLVHVPLLSHPDPKHLLVIGGGDGGTLREAARHPGLERLDICELDGEVIEASKRFLPGLAAGFADPRVRVHLADGAAFVKDRPGTYDVILVDSSDPDGPAQVLYSQGFYQDLKRALKPGGIICSQMESFYTYADHIQHTMAMINGLFPLTYFYNTLVPTYLSGVIGFAFCSLGPDPRTGPDPARLAALGRMEYYSAAMHRAAFALPARCLRLMPSEVAARQGDVS